MCTRTNNDPPTTTHNLKQDELMWLGRVSCSCSTSGIRHGTLVSNQVMRHEWGKDRIVITTNETYPWSFVINKMIIYGMMYLYRLFTACTT